LWHRDAERSRGLEVDDHFEVRRLLYWQICRPRTFEDAIDVTGQAHEALALAASGKMRAQPVARVNRRRFTRSPGSADYYRLPNFDAAQKASLIFDSIIAPNEQAAFVQPNDKELDERPRLREVRP
jgi:hypothetical protein